MNPKEGIRRIRLLAKRLLVIGAVALAVGIWLAIVSHYARIAIALLPIWPIVAFWGISAGTLLWMLAWIIEGFTADAN